MKALLYLLQNQEKYTRPLFLCAIIHLLLAPIFFTTLLLDQRELLGVNLWVKPLKFALSIGIYSLTWVVLLPYMQGQKSKRFFVLFTTFAMGFEMLCVASQAARGELSHFNQSGTYNTILYSLMGVIITIQTLFSLYLSIQFFKHEPSKLSQPMIWAIRLGIMISIFFAMQGGLIGQRMAHTVGAADGGPGILFFNWSTKHGDLRIAHFFGLHALQILPAFVWMFKIKRKVAIIVIGLMYFSFVSLLFYHALMGKAIYDLSARNTHQHSIVRFNNS